MNMRDDIMERRRQFCNEWMEYPSELFVSLEWHSRLLEELKRKEYIPRNQTSLHGDKFCGMTIHVVPTLKAGFAVG